MKTYTLACLAALGVGAGLDAVAAPVTWAVDISLNDSFFPGDPVTQSEQLTGAFTYDFSAATFTDVNLAISGTSGAFAYHFARPRFGALGPYIVDLFVADPGVTDLTGESSLAIGFNASTGLLDFSNALGSFPVTSYVTDPFYVVQSSRQECVSSDCIVTSGVITLAHAGILKGSPVPLPATVLLLCPAIGVLHRARRRHA